MTTAQAPYAALDSQLAQIEFWQSANAEIFLDYVVGHRYGAGGAKTKDGADLWQEMLLKNLDKRFLNAVPHFVAGEIQHLVEGSMDEFPGDITWNAILPDAQVGFAYFEDGFILPASGTEQPSPRLCRAILWFPTTYPRAGIGWLLMTDAGDGPLGFLPIFLAHTTFLDTDLNDVRGDSEMLPVMVYSCNFTAAFFAFLRQKLVSTQGERPPRPTRKRFFRATHAEAPLVRVIQLRKREVRGKENGHGGPRDWSHRWIVSGHWRKQWYPTRQRHEPLFIDSYVKGPDDKPLKARRVNLYAVVN